MAYDENLAARIRRMLAPEDEVSERKMFGGLAFLIRDHMTVVAGGQGALMIRADPSQSAQLVETTPAQFAEMRGRPMKGWLCLESGDVESDDELRRWVDHAVHYSSTLPPKSTVPPED